MNDKVSKIATKFPIKMPFTNVENCNQVVKIRYIEVFPCKYCQKWYHLGKQKADTGNVLHYVYSCNLLTSQEHVHKFELKYVEFLQLVKKLIFSIWNKRIMAFSAYMWKIMCLNMLQLLKNFELCQQLAWESRTNTVENILYPILVSLSNTFCSNICKGNHQVFPHLDNSASVFMNSILIGSLVSIFQLTIPGDTLSWKAT